MKIKLQNKKFSIILTIIVATILFIFGVIPVLFNIFFRGKTKGYGRVREKP